jgi:ubiquinone/menaquinone biosynthesis C-methylase UbiE
MESVSEGDFGDPSGLLWIIMKNITQATYDQIAPAFAKVNAEMPENVLLAARKFLKAIPTNGLCLDLGCGSGRDIAWFEQQNITILGADFSTGMLLQARKITACPLAQMDMLNLGFANESFSGIWCNAAFLHLPKADAPQALKEMRRILCNGGILDLAVQEGAGEQFETNPYDASQGERFFARYHEDEMKQMLVANGFTILEMKQVPSKHAWLRFVAQAKQHSHE